VCALLEYILVGPRGIDKEKESFIRILREKGYDGKEFSHSKWTTH
jgi:hypothetical protein